MRKVNLSILHTLRTEIHYRNARIKARRMLEYIIPIFYPKKPTQVIVMVGNIVFGASERDVNWALVMRDTVKRLLTRISKLKPTPICTYLLHLYIAYNAVQPDNKKAYLVIESFMKHDVEPDEEQPEGTENSD